MEYLGAILLGFLGSFHCVGMCGPIALAIPQRKPGKLNTFIDNITYNYGRIVTYALLGALFGLLGRGLRIAGLQENLSLFIGATILIFLLIPRKVSSKLNALPFIGFFLNSVKQKLGLMLKPKSSLGLFSLGLINGLLPCGLVYVALAGSIATSDWLTGAIFMGAFGLGTLPAMGILFQSKSLISISFRNKINQFIPIAIASIAILMMLRGMHLGIPYVSPKLTTNIIEVQDENCNEVLIENKEQRINSNDN